MGDATTTTALTAVDKLALQANRFGPDAPAAYQFHTTAFAIGNPLDLDLASTAMLIYQRRAIDSFAKFADAASAKLIANANAGMADPVSWVTANLPDVTSVLKGYGDSVGLAPAPGDVSETVFSMSPLGVPIYVWGGATLVALLVLSQKKRR